MSVPLALAEQGILSSVPLALSDQGSLTSVPLALAEHGNLSSVPLTLFASVLLFNLIMKWFFQKSQW